MITDWVDKVAEVWGTIDNGKGGSLRSYKVFKRAEFPESLNEFPCALTIVPRVPKIQYSAGGPCLAVYDGVSEFHIAKNINKSNYPFVLTYFEKIIVAAAANLQLGGAVEHFLLANSNPIAMNVLQYGSEDAHLGLVVTWQVKELMNGLAVSS